MIAREAAPPTAGERNTLKRARRNEIADAPETPFYRHLNDVLTTHIPLPLDLKWDDSMSAKVLISYSHDSPAHEQRVLVVADRLRRDGVDAMLDQYEQFPSGGWIQWMKDQISDADFVLVICTETYRRRADGREAPGVGLGATYESQILQQILYDAGGRNDRIIPVILDPADRVYIPTELKRYRCFTLDSDTDYFDLYRLLTKQPQVAKPIIGQPLQLREPRLDFRNLVWNVPPRNPYFTGREEQLAAMHDEFTAGATVVLTQAIRGMAGIGKTQTAVEYAHRHRADYQAVLWTVADSPEALTSGFAQCAALLDLPERDDRDLKVVAAAARRWLESNGHWLLVLDNVEEMKIVPTGLPGNILVTTRQRGTGQYARPVDIPKMDPDSGAKFLVRRAKLDGLVHVDLAAARQLSEELGGLPLALDQAAAFIEETPSTFAEYLDIYRKEGKVLRARRGDQSPDHASVTVTFSLAIQRASPAAAALVRACSFLAPDAIPEMVFTQAATRWGDPLASVASEPLAWLETIREAGRLGLIDRDPKDASLDVHRLLQEVVKDEMTEDIRRFWTDLAVAALNDVFPKPEVFANWPVCERLLAHSRNVAALTEAFGIQSPETACLLNDTAYYLWLRGQYAEGEPLYRRALEIREECLGPNDPDTAVTLNCLAALLADDNRRAEAEPLYRRSLDIRERVLGPDHAATAIVLNNLGELLRKQQQPDLAEPLLDRALAIREATLGPEHPATAITLNNLAAVYEDKGNYEKAEPLYRRSLQIRENALGLEHPSTALGLNNLALLLTRQSRRDEAEPLFRRALVIWEKTLGHNHPHTALCVTNFVTLLRELDRSEEAGIVAARAHAHQRPSRRYAEG